MQKLIGVVTKGAWSLISACGPNMSQFCDSQTWQLCTLIEETAALLGYISKLKRRTEESCEGLCRREGCACIPANGIWEVAMLRATAAGFRQTKRDGGKESNRYMCTRTHMYINTVRPASARNAKIF